MNNSDGNNVHCGRGISITDWGVSLWHSHGGRSILRRVSAVEEKIRGLPKIFDDLRQKTTTWRLTSPIFIKILFSKVSNREYFGFGNQNYSYKRIFEVIQGNFDLQKFFRSQKASQS